MARSVRFTKAERELLGFALGGVVPFTPKQAKVRDGIFKKLSDSEAAAATVDVGPIEEALIATARGKVVALEGGYPRARVQATAVGATVDDAKLLGGWMARQGWLTGPMTLLDVLNKWVMWIPKARATQPPPALEQGLGDSRVSASVVPEKPGQGPGKGRALPGFR